MTKTRVVFGSMILLLVVGLVLAACTGAKDDPADLDGKALAEERCTQCHSYDRVEAAKKPADAWASTVDRMINHGANLNDAEKAAVIAHLTEAYPE